MFLPNQSLKPFYYYKSCRTRMGEHQLSAGSADKRMYWLSQLQRARREFSQAGAAAVAKNSMSCKVSQPFFSRAHYYLSFQTLALPYFELQA